MEPANEEDLVSKLPDDILVCILEKLEVRVAVRAGVLSRRWRSLPHQLPRLALDFNDFLPEEEDNYYEDEGDDELELPPADDTPDTLAQASQAMLDAMAALLTSRAAVGGGGCTASCTLAVSFLLRRNYMSIGRLLDDAMSSGKAHAIEMTISTTFDSNDGGDDVEHTANVFLAYGRRFKTLLDGCPTAFGGLTRLTIKNIKFCGPDLHDVLAACTRLEAISLLDCHCEVPCVQHARLAEVTLTDCVFSGVVHLAWLPRLQQLTCRMWRTRRPRVSFGHVPRLAIVTLSNFQLVVQPALRLSQILANTTAVTKLRLNFKGQNMWVKPEGPKRFTNMFCNLKHVKIRNLHDDCGLSWITFLLQASPCLKELHIKLCDHECVNQDEENEDNFAAKKTNVTWEVAADFKHYGLTRITIILGLHNYNIGERVVAYIHRLVVAAVNLEEIRVCKNTHCRKCGVKGTGFPSTEQERDSLRQWISGGEPVAFKICIQT